jgi:HlyD family secretion protein
VSLKGRGLRWLLISLAIVAGVSSIFAVRALLRRSDPVDPSKLAAVERGDIARAVVATGKIQPLTKIEIKSKASGIVKQILVDYGEKVRTGQVLVELDKEEIQTHVREAQAMLVAAQASLESSQASLERNQLDAESPDLPFLKSSVERSKKLLADGLISQALLEDADKAYRVALNRQLMALRNVAITRGEVSRAKAQVAQAQASLERSQEELRYSTITSSMDGLVLSRNVNPGDSVSSILVMGSQATLLLTLGDVSQVYVQGKVQESDIDKVYLGQRARIAVESLRDKKFEGKVDKISPLGVEKENVTTFEVRVSIANPAGELKANMSANAEIIHEEKKGVLLIPEAAVEYGKNGETSVSVPDVRAPEGRRKAPVKIGISNGTKSEVLAGLAEGQKVILR